MRMNVDQKLLKLAEDYGKLIKLNKAQRAQRHFIRGKAETLIRKSYPVNQDAIWAEWCEQAQKNQNSIQFLHRENVHDFVSNMTHANLGSCFIEHACRNLQSKNVDPTSMFVRLPNGEILEVSKNRVSTI